MSNAFQRAMSEIFADMPFVKIYIDNLIVASRTFEEHEQRVRAVIERLTEANLRLAVPKLKIGKELRLLGMLISKDGIKPDPKKIEGIMACPFPEDVTALQSFLGMINFFRPHFRHLGDVEYHLNKARASAKAFDFELEHNKEIMEHNFHLIKEAIAMAPRLNYPDFERPFYLAVDASQLAVGAVLYQPSVAQLAVGDNSITSSNIVAIHSRALRASERNYMTKPYKLEAFAMIEALRHFRDYLYGRHFHLLTDHRALTYMFNKRIHPTLAGWLSEILEFDFTITHIPGKNNLLPDHLSRMYSKSKVWGVETMGSDSMYSQFEHLPRNVSHKYDTNASFPLQEPIAVRIIDSDASFPLQEPITGTIDIGVRPPDKLQERTHTKTHSLHALDTMRQRAPVTPEQFEYMSLLGKTIPKDDQRITLIDRAHSQGHYSEVVLVDLIYNKWNFWWPSLRADVRHRTATCSQCQRYNVTQHGYHPQSSPTAFMPGDWWQLDIMELPVSVNGYSHVLCILDLFTSYLITRPMKTKSREETAKLLYEVICDWGPPKIVQTDDGGEFANTLLRSMFQKMDIEFHISAPKYHGSTGRVERAIRTLRFSLNKMLDGATAIWDVILPLATFYYNITMKSLHKSSPYVLMFARDYNTNTNSEKHPLLVPDNEDEDWVESEYHDWVTHQLDVLTSVYPHLREAVADTRQAQHKKFDASHKQVAHFRLGQKVLAHDYARTLKNAPRMVGPYTIIEIRPTHTYVISDGINEPLIRHASALKKWLEPPNHGVHAVIPHADTDELDASNKAQPLSHSANNTPALDAFSKLQPPSRSVDAEMPNTNALKAVYSEQQRADELDEKHIDTFDNDTTSFQVEYLVSHRGSRNNIEYLVKWSGYDSSENSWTPASNFNDTECIRLYWQQKAPQRATKRVSKRLSDRRLASSSNEPPLRKRKS